MHSSLHSVVHMESPYRNGFPQFRCTANGEYREALDDYRRAVAYFDAAKELFRHAVELCPEEADYNEYWVKSQRQRVSVVR